MVFSGDDACGIMLSNVLLLLYVRVCIPFVLYVLLCLFVCCYDCFIWGSIDLYYFVGIVVLGIT